MPDAATRMCVCLPLCPMARTHSQTRHGVPRPRLFAHGCLELPIDVKSLDSFVVEYSVEVRLAQLLAQFIHELQQTGG